MLNQALSKDIATGYEECSVFHVGIETERLNMLYFLLYFGECMNINLKD